MLINMKGGLSYLRQTSFSVSEVDVNTNSYREYKNSSYREYIKVLIGNIKTRNNIIKTKRYECN